MDCLITKLKGTVNDGSLPKLGSMLFKLRTTTTNLVKIEAIGKDVSFSSADGSNIFSMSSGGEEKTNVINVGESNTVFYVDTSKGVTISIDNKYNLEKLDVYPFEDNKELTVDLNFEDLKYCKKLSWLALSYMRLSGDISALQNLTALTYINLDGTQVTGDISALQNLTALTSIKLAYTQLSGDISALQNLTALTYINLDSTQLSGDISALQNLTALTYIQLNDTQLSGDISVLDKLTKLTTFNCYNGGDFTGDFFGKLASKDWTLFQCNGNFTYTTKNYNGRTYKSVGSNRCNCDNLDAFLNDFQTVNSTTNGELIMTGTRTSASDAAVSALQGKGFTVTVPSATDANSISTMSERINENYGIAYKDKELIVEPVDLTKMQIYPASGVTVKTFDTKENAEKFIEDNRFV